jgi:osmoprotectant transport system permease protein
VNSLCLLLALMGADEPSPVAAPSPAPASAPSSAPKTTPAPTPNTAPIQVGSKAFTESVILGELLVQVGREAGFTMRHRRELGGTGLVWKALLAGDIDIYPDYTGTIAESILKNPSLRDEQEIRRELAQLGVRMSAPLGFENAYALGMREVTARELGIRKISDLQQHPNLIFGFGNEFLDRTDGWPSLRQRYELPQTRVSGLDHMLAYRALERDDIQLMDIYTTDANLHVYGLQALVDDLQHFPKYDAVLLYRDDLLERAPAFVEAIGRLEGLLTRDDMLAMNVAVDVEQDAEQRVAVNYLFGKLAIGRRMEKPTGADKWWALFRRLARFTLQHLLLVVVSLAAAIAVAVPLGVVAAKFPKLGQAILSVAEIVQTIPGLALMILLMTPVGWLGFSSVGPAPVIVALFLYSLLPVIRNTYTGIHDIPNSVRESATALGLTPRAQLFQVELPMASRLILAGIKTTAVINVGYATLGGLIGAGGYGDLIMQGIRTSSEVKMLEGAVPAAVMALAVKWLFEWSERFLVPQGLRLQSAS